VNTQLSDEQPMNTDREQQVDDAVHRMLSARRESVRTKIPVHIERRIRLSLGEAAEQQSAPQPVSLLASLASFFRKPLVLVPSSLGMVAIAALLIFRSSSQTPVDLHKIAYANFSGVVNGDISLVKQTSDTNELRAFFATAGVNYPVFFPAMKAQLKGGVVSTENGHSFAHVVYEIGDHVVYLFEADQVAIDANLASLDTMITNDLSTGKWHWEERPGTGTLFVWKSNNVVCLAVSDLRTQDMSALFTLEAL